jgi:PKD repeat protein
VYYGDITRHFNNGSDVNIARNGAFGINEEGDWVTPYTLHLTDPTKMFIGYKNVWRGKNIRGVPVWTKISDNLGNNNTTNMRIVEQSPVNPDVFYAARWDKKLFRSDNVNADVVNWITIALPSNETPSAIRPNPFDENLVYMALNGKIYKSVNRGDAWTDISGSLPNVEYTSIAYYKNSLEGLYISSDIGVFYKDSTMSDWVNYSAKLPVDASIREIEICYNATTNEKDLITAGTFGRGVWMSPVWRINPDAAFVSDITMVPTTGAVQFKDLSAGVPSSWHWIFEGGSLATSTDKNPVVNYNTAGTYDVKLVVENSVGSDSVLFENYITVSSTLLPVAGFYSSNTAPCNGYSVNFYDTTQFSPTSWNWEFEPNTINFLNGTSATSQNPVVQFNQNTAYNVKLTATNPNGANSITRMNYIHVGGYLIPFEEDFESGLDSKSWTVVNPDNETTWAVRDVNGNSGGSKAAYMNLFVYYRMNQRDQLISPTMNFEGFSKVFLSFDHAYAQRLNQKDSLIVYVSQNCGDTWKRVWANGPNGSGIFETAPSTSDEFIPTVADDWCGNGWGAQCTELDLSELAGLSNCRIMFECYNKLGNNLYIDNVFVSNYGVGISETANSGFTVTPNPSDGRFIIEWSGKSEATIELYNAAGQQIYATRANTGSGIFTKELNLNQIPSGLYFFKVETSDKTYYQKIVIR